MKDILKIVVRRDYELILQSDFIRLDPFAPNSGRKFTFYNVTGFDCSVGEWDELTVFIHVFNKNRIECLELVFNFQVFDLESDILLNNSWWMYGSISNIGEKEYRQGELDVLNMWQNNVPTNWTDLPIGAPEKQSYFPLAVFMLASVRQF